MSHLLGILCIVFSKKGYKRGDNRSKIVDQLQFEKKRQAKQRIDSITNSMVFAEEVMNSKPSKLHYFIYWERKTYAENT